MKKLFQIFIVIAALVALGAASTVRISDVVGLYTELANRPKISDGVNPWDYVYSKKQVQELPIQDALVAGLQSYGSTIKALPYGLVLSNLFATQTTLSDGVIYDMLFEIKDTITVTGVGWVQQTQGNYTADGYNGFAINTVLGGTDTKLVETANDGNIWKAVAGSATKAFPTQQVLLPGNYKITALWNASATITAPIVYAHTTVGGNVIYLLPNNQKISGTLSSQATMPASIAGSSLISVSNYLGIWLY